MKHRTLFLLLVLTSASAYGQVITRLSNGQSHFYYDVSDLVGVVANANPNDTIILPGGPINLEGSLLIDKPLVLIGAGVSSPGTPVTGITTLIGTWVAGGYEEVVITFPGRTSSLHGIEFQAPVKFAGFGNNDPAFSFAFLRCVFAGSFALGGWASPVTPPAASNVTVKQCIFLEGISNSGSTAPQGFTVTNCFIEGGIEFGSTYIASADITQCVIFNMTTLSAVNEGVVFSNNIFTRSSSTYNLNSAATYRNNLFAMTTGPATLSWTGAVDGGGNVSTQIVTASSVFQNCPVVTAYNSTYNYHINGGPAAGIGLNGYDVGVYDGAPGNAWKENAIPFNPHWLQLLPVGSLGSTNGGLINVSFTGVAQQD